MVFMTLLFSSRWYIIEGSILYKYILIYTLTFLETFKGKFLLNPLVQFYYYNNLNNILKPWKETIQKIAQHQ